MLYMQMLLSGFSEMSNTLIHFELGRYIHFIQLVSPVSRRIFNLSNLLTRITSESDVGVAAEEWWMILFN